MAKTIKEKIEEKILNVGYAETLQKSYIDYAMSVIVARALPDVRDGLKPVHRRILYDMDELGANSDKAYRKSARIVGDTMGKYHPHGDSSIYNTEVVLSQEFKCAIPLIDGQGNFGSIEGDGAAAQRYTECKLTKYSEKVLLDELKNHTVDFMPNYDATEFEPVALPSKLPNILINGSSGIAVGVATSMPPHNINEVVDTIIKYIDNPKATTEELLETLKGPDFPTGGVISNKSELLSIYETGVGKIRIRGKIDIEDNGKDKKNIVISEVPYTMVGAGIGKFLTSVAELVENRTIEGVADISNLTSKAGVRIVIELKKGVDAENIVNILLKKTKLEDTFGVQNLVIHNNEPKTMGLKALLDCYLDFQYEIYTRKYEYILGKLNKKKVVTEGLVKALDVISEIIETIRFAENIKKAKECLITGDTSGIKFRTKGFEDIAKTFDFSEEQAEAICAMRLSQLNGLEINKLQKEYKDILKEIQKCEKILGSKTVMKNEIKKTVLELKEEFSQERKTEIIDAQPIVIVEKEVEEENITVLVDRFGYIHSVDYTQYEKNKEYIEENFKYIIQSTNKRKLLIFTNKGKVHTLKPNEIPYLKLKDKGQPLDNISGYDSRVEDVIYITELPPMEDDGTENSLIFLSTDGYIKRVDLAEFDVTRKTIDATKLNNNEELVGIYKYGKGQIVIGTTNGYYTRFLQEQIPQKKKMAVGAICMKLDDDKIAYGVCVKNGSEAIVINDIETQASRVKQSNRGAKGVKLRM